MAENTINWGKIYQSSYWGVGVNNNSISWGIVYLYEAGFSALTTRYSDRVESDSGTVESESCVNNADFRNNDWDFYYRVIDDSGVVESLECVDIN